MRESLVLLRNGHLFLDSAFCDLAMVLSSISYAMQSIGQILARYLLGGLGHLNYLTLHHTASVSPFIKQLVELPPRSLEALNSYSAGPQVSLDSTSVQGMCWLESSPSN